VVAYLETQDSFGTEGLKRCIKHAIGHDGYIGGWLNEDNGKFYFDSVKIFPVSQQKEAIEFGRANKQI
jgi:fructokinase